MTRRIGGWARANAIALLALFLAMAGTGWAAAKIGANDVRNDAIKARHIDDRQVAGSELAGNAVTSGKLAADAVGTGDLAPTPRASIVTDEAQTFESALADVSFDQFFLSDDGEMDASANQVTVDTAGVYALTGEIHWDADPAGDRLLRLVVVEPGDDAEFPSADHRRAALGSTTGVVTATESLPSGTTIGMQAAQSSGTPLDTEELNGYTAELTVQYLGPRPGILAR